MKFKILLIFILFVGCNEQTVKSTILELKSSDIFFNSNTNIKTYAIVDTVNHENTLLNEFLSKKSKYKNLWHDKIVKYTESVPLYLIQLNKEDDKKLLSLLLKTYTKTVYFQSTYNINEIHEYYSRFTYPFIHLKGKTIRSIFGFYDKNIFQKYIRTLYSNEIRDKLFERVNIWFMSTKNFNEILLYYRDKDKKIQSEVININSKIKQNKILKFLNVKESTTTIDDDVYLDGKQINIFEDMEMYIFIDELLLEYKEEGYTFHTQYTSEELIQITMNLTKEAKKIGLSMESSMYYYVLTAFLAEKKSLINTKIYNKIKVLKKEFLKLNILKRKVEKNNG